MVEVAKYNVFLDRVGDEENGKVSIRVRNQESQYDYVGDALMDPSYLPKVNHWI